MSQDENENSPLDKSGPQTDPIHQTPSQPHGLEEESHHSTMASDEPRDLANREADHIVKICKSCMVSQRGGGNFCVKCGAELVPIRAVRNSCIGDVVGGKYTIIETIGSGGMGDVYLGINEPLGQRVAVKFLNQKFTSDEKIVLRFLNEARSYCRVNHPNAVTLLEYGQHDDGSLYLITEFIEGESLTELVRQKGPLPTETIVSMGVQICEVLTAAHGQGVIHRDLKPDNLMMMPGPRGRYAVKVLDFGIAKIADEDPGAGMTETGSVFGTPEFMSPEQARGDSADPRSDLYALGVLLYFVSTAKLPFRGKNKFAILNKQLNEEPKRPNSVRKNGEVHPELEEIILHCLKKSPDDRPQTADAIVEALESIDMNWTPAPKKKETPAPESPEAADGNDGTEKESVVKPLGASSFDEIGDAPMDMSFEEGIDPLAPTLGGEFADESSPEGEWNGEISISDTGRERIFRVDPSLGRPLRMRQTVVGVVVTLAVVGAVIFWTSGPGGDADGGASMEEAQKRVWSGRSAAVVALAARYVDDGDFAAADSALAGLDDPAESEVDNKAFDELIRRASRARNTEMRLRSAIESQRCDEAGELLRNLKDLSPGAGAARLDLVEQCGAEPAVAEVEAAEETEVVAPPSIRSPAPRAPAPEPEPPAQKPEPEPEPVVEEESSPIESPEVEPEAEPQEDPEPQVEEKEEAPEDMPGEEISEDEQGEEPEEGKEVEEGEEAEEAEDEGRPPRRI